MVGTIEKQNSNLIPVTLAGPAEGIISKVAYCCDIDYEIVVTNGGIGTGFVGVSTCCPITYNPWCCVGTDPDTGEEIHKGVLKVDCLIAEDMQGAECACYIWKEQSNSNVSLSIPLWNTDQIGDGYFGLQESGGYPLTYNPISGYLNACRVCTNYVQVNGGCILQQNATATTVVTPSVTCILGNDCKYDYVFESHTDSPITIGFNETNNESYVSADVFCGEKLYTDDILTDRVCSKSEDWHYIDLSGGLTTFSCPVRVMEEIYADTICGACLTLYGDTCVELYQNNGDTCACLKICSGCFLMCGCSDMCFATNGAIRTNTDLICAESTVIEACCLCVECGIHTGYDIIGYCDGDLTGSTSWYIYCDGSGCFTNADSWRLPSDVTKCDNSTWGTYANCRTIPNAHEIRCYLYNRCAATAYSSGTTLFIRTQGNAGWS